MVTQIRAECDTHFRWFDSGDVQSTKHARDIIKIARQTPHIDHWSPSLELSTWNSVKDAIPGNLVVRLSSTKLERPRRTKNFVTSYIKKCSLEFWKGLVAKNTKKEHHCPAPLQNNKCGSCRACWDPKIQTVVYHQH